MPAIAIVGNDGSGKTSVVEYFQGYLGIPPFGFPEPLRSEVVKDRKIAGYYSMKDDLINAGAVYTDKPAVVDNNIITTAHYKDMGPWMKEALKVLYKK